MQVETNFIRRNATSGLQQCTRSSKIYDAIVCPPGHFRRREEEVLAGCELAGLPCDEGFQCICRPCVKSFDVDVFPVFDDGSLFRDADSTGQTTTAASAAVDDEESPVGCPKMELCGSIEQGKPIRFRAIDNKKRSGIDMSVFVHAGQSETREIQATPVLPVGNETESFMYDFVISEPRVGVVVLEILAGGEQIPESPLRLEVTPRNCAADNDDPLSVAQADGSCSCAANSVDIGGQCVSYAILLPAIILPLLAIAAVGIFFYIKQKHKAADSVWHVKEKELEFDDPPQIIGRGTFGLVLLAEYRGTQVAVKRVIPRSNGGLLIVAGLVLHRQTAPLLSQSIKDIPFFPMHRGLEIPLLLQERQIVLRRWRVLPKGKTRAMPIQAMRLHLLASERK